MGNQLLLPCKWTINIIAHGGKYEWMYVLSTNKIQLIWINGSICKQ